MDESSLVTGAGADTPSSIPTRPAPGRKRSSSGAGSLLSKLPFMRNSGEHRPRSRRNTNETEISTFPPTPSFTSIPADTPPRHTGAPIAAPLPLPHIIQHQIQQPQSLKTRRRRGSLRKVALLGRGAQREKRDRGLTIDTKLDVYGGPDGRHNETKAAGTAPTSITSNPSPLRNNSGILKNTINTSIPYGLGISDLTPRPSMDGYASRSNSQSSDPDATPTTALAPINANPPPSSRNSVTGSRSPSISYSTTDDEDALHMAVPAGLNSSTSNLSSSSSVNLLRPERASVSSASGSESYFLNLPHSPHSPPRPLSLGSGTSGSSILPTLQRRRGTVQRAKSPLALTSLAALSTTPLPPPDSDWDYSETEWWGWVVLGVTWTVFVIGMGSCLEVWSWAWDVGTTPYAPPELEDDPTLPIVGYYPALIILSCVMAWVWVVVAWVGMKYFRHARVNGD
ncbi:hypothetical protein QBC40DRAFT_235358 [Triangularia verruculosa]|uniref:Uncharacterized protein n=1 Tax=Triangularia verruculosa TaxID=2587418 RepID=A0AAN6X8A3_9PEZI|nr:hypothetical protein QBC40DRAFT_235358 [Triangularia verruculosa]